MLDWLRTNWLEALPVAVVLLSTLATALTRYPRAGEVAYWLRWLAGLLSVLAHRDGRGLVGPLTLPGLPQRRPPDGPPPGHGGGLGAVVALLALAGLAGACGAHPRAILRGSRLTADGVAASFGAAYQGAALRCRGEMLRAAPPDRLRLYSGCMARWDSAADQVALALDDLGAAARAALAGIEVWEAGGGRAPVAELLARVGRLLGELAALAEQLASGSAAPAPLPPASQPASRPAAMVLG